MTKVDLSVNFAGLQMKNPVTTASGTFAARESGEFYDISRLGAVITKGVAAEPWQARLLSTRNAEIALEITVASATPATSICSTSTKNRLNTTLSAPLTVINTSGRRLSPTARSIAAPKLYSRLNTLPPRMIRI